MRKNKLPDFSEKPVKTIARQSVKLCSDLTKNCTNIRALINNSTDLIIKYAEINGIRAAIVTVEGMIDKMKLADLIYRPLINNVPDCCTPKETLDKISLMLIAEEQKQFYSCDEALHSAMSGFAVILIDGADYALAVGIQGYAHRAVGEPSTHINLRASREGFVEVVRTNVAMVRRRLKTPTLKTELLKVGSRSNTDICVCYLTDKTDMRTVCEVMDRLKTIPLTTVLSSEYLQAFLEQNDSGLFSQVMTTERPDVFASKLYEGRIGIIVDGTPFSLILPSLFIENFQAMDDYTHRPYFSAFMRTLRLIAFILAVILPGLYVALCNFNPEIIRSSLLLNIYSSIQTTAFPVFGECLVMYILYEIMREAGLRLPKSVGHAVSIVGGLVIGEITVSAGLMSAPVVLIIAATGLCSFAVPDLYESCMILRLLFILAGGAFGLFGITAMGVLLLFRLCSKNAYGVPYTAPFAPFTLKSVIRDTFVRVGWKRLAKSDVAVSQLSGTAKRKNTEERVMYSEQDKR